VLVYGLWYREKEERSELYKESLGINLLPFATRYSPLGYLTFVLHDRSLSFVARDESRMAEGEPRITEGEPRMTGDCCRPEESIHRCVRMHSHLYSYIYGLVALLDNIQSSFSSITISTICDNPPSSSTP
jgi:hypothetical protein